MANSKLTKAKTAKKDEFYTQYSDIENEMNAYIDYDPDVFRGKVILLPCDDPEWSNFTRYFVQNFERFGLKKLISTSYAPKSKSDLFGYHPNEIESSSEHFDEERSKTHGRICSVTGDRNFDGKIDINDIDWDYLEGDGDFRSDEVARLREEADIIITNPPFSLFREFVAWIGDKSFIAVGHQNAITYKEIFPLIKNNKAWLGRGFKGGAGFFINQHYEDYATATAKEEGKIRVSGVTWFTNLKHGRRHQPLQLMTMADNLKFNKKMKGKTAYDRYDNYDAIEVPFTNAIPSDYDGAMGVPITFLDKYCPEQFDIIGATESEGKGFSNGLWNPDSQIAQGTVHGKKVYKRIFIKRRK